MKKKLIKNNKDMQIKLTKQDYCKIAYKLFFAIATLSVVFVFYFIGLFNLKIHYDGGTNKGPDYYNYFAANGNNYSVQFFSYFTIQSNLLCAMVFLMAGIWHRKENKIKILGHRFVIAVAVFISITALIFNTLLLPQTLSNGDSLSAVTWFQLMYEHAALPIAYVVYALFLFNNRKKITNYSQALSRDAFLYIAYPLGYCLFILIKGYLIEYQINSVLPAGQSFSTPGIFQYFFLDFDQTTFGLPGYAWFIIVFFLILGIIFGLTAAYTAITNAMIKHQSAKTA